MLIDNNHTRGSEDLFIWVTVEQLCCIFETIIRLYINDTLIKKLKAVKNVMQTKVQKQHRNQILT